MKSSRATTLLVWGFSVALMSTACGSSSGISGQAGAGGHGPADAGGNAGAAGGAAGSAGNARMTGGDAGAAGGGAGTSGGHGGNAGTSGGSAGGASVACAEPVPCEGYDDRPDAHLAAAISCLSPSAVPANAPFTLAIYGHHLATGAGQYAIVTLDSGTPLNGVPVTACHLDVQVPADQIATARQASVVVSPGGWTLASPPALLTVH
jgi:hypothetical protein